MLLQNKNAVIYGAGPSLGGAVAQAFARQGARVFVTHHDIARAQQVADTIQAAGGKAEAAAVDALDDKEVQQHIDEVLQKAGSVDISFNAINIRDVQDIPLVKMTIDDFLRPIQTAMRTQFITTTAAGRVMIKQQSGVILSLTATPGGIGYGGVGGFGPACCAIEGYSRDLAIELGVHGVRVVNIRSAGSPDSAPFVAAVKEHGDAVNEIINMLANDTMLKQLPMMEDIANTAVFLASSMAAKITGVTIDVTAGTTNGINYKTGNNVPFGQ